MAWRDHENDRRLKMGLITIMSHVMMHDALVLSLPWISLSRDIKHLHAPPIHKVKAEMKYLCVFRGDRGSSALSYQSVGKAKVGTSGRIFMDGKP